MKLAILTATYNHPDNLHVLYGSLKGQIDKDFTWIIVNDGSSAETEITIKKFYENVINIKYISQDNHGKSFAINTGLDWAKDFDFVLIVDDDENLYSNATTLIKESYNKFAGQRCSAIVFSRADLNGNPLINKNVTEDQLYSFQKRRRLDIFSDGYIGYYVKTLQNKRFPIYNNEKYIGPSVLLMESSKGCSIVWSTTILGKTDYLDGGITKQGRKLRLKNPKGMIKYCSLMQVNDSGFKLRLKYSIMAYAYMYFAHLSKEDLDKEGLSISRFLHVRLLGLMLHLYWKYNYNEKKQRA